MSKLLFISSLLFCFSFINLEPLPTCQCPSSHELPKEIEIDKNFSPSNIIIDNVNYGKPVAIGEYIFLSKDLPIDRGITSLSYSCPTGFRLPTKSEYEDLLSYLGSNADSILTDRSGFNFKSGKLYMTSEKVYSSTDGSNNEAWCFYGLGNSGKNYEVKIVNSYWDLSSMVARCMMDIDNVKFNVDGLTYDLLTDEKRTLTIDKSMLKGILWKIDNKISSSAKLEITNTKRGCDILEIWGIALNDQLLYDCRIFYTRPKLGNSIEASFTINKVSTLRYTFSSDRVSSIYFERPQAPITPKYDGGYYLAYNKKSNKKLTVVEFDSDDSIITEEELEYNAFPLDIIETDYGFAIYARDVTDIHHSFVVTYNFDYTKRVETTIMNNGDQPTSTRDALVFYDLNGKALFGIDKMFNPHNGKLAYGQGKLNLIFAHYNNFDESGGHTGDSYYSLDLSGESQNAKYAWSWLTSHSLIQSHIYDGKYFITAALGDAYPEGISLAIIDINKGGNAYDSVRKNYPDLRYVSDSNLIGYITGNHIGNSYGRLGGILEFDSIYALIYSIKKSSGDDRDGIMLTKFSYENGDIHLISTDYILHGIAGKLKNLRCGKYGGRILITYILNKTDYGLDYSPYYQDLNEETYYLVSDLDGTVTAGPFRSDEQNEALSEDLRELKDGSLRWGYVDSKNVLRIVKVDAPSE